MREAVKWVLLGVVTLVIGPISGWLTGRVPAPNGGPHATMLLSAAPLVAILGTILAFALAAMCGVVVGKVGRVRWGLFSAGVVLAWASFESGTVPGVLLWTRGGDGVFARLAFEGLLLGLLGVVVGLLIQRAAEHDLPEGAPEPAEPRRRADAFVGLGVGVVVGALAAWVIAREGLKGQTFAAGAISGVFSATAGRLAAPTSPPISFIAAGAILAILGPLTGIFVQSGDPLLAANANDLFPLALLSPLDWIGGAFFGVPLGLSWAASLTERRSA